MLIKKMVLFNLKKDASHVRQQMASSLIEFCRASFKYDTELNIEGMVCVTVDKQDVLPIPVNILLQKTSKAVPNSGLNTSFTQAAAIHSKSQTPKANTTLDMPSDLQSAQAVLQSLLAKTPTSQQPEFIPLGDMGSLADGINKDNLQSRQSVKLQAENDNDVDMEEEGVREDVDEGIHSQDSQPNKTATLQESVGNVIKSFYQGNVSTTSPLQQNSTLSSATAASTSSVGQASTPLQSPLTVIKVIQPNTSAATSRYQQNLTPQQKLASALSWKHEAPKKFQCPMCKYTSDRRFCINRHMKLHVGRAGVQCQICQNIFADHWYLTKVHMPKHHPESVGGSSNGTTVTTNTTTTSTQSQDSGATGRVLPTNSLTAKECSIKCPVCPFTASSAISFRNHLNTHSRDCLKCGLRFLTPEDVQQHVHQQHGDDVDFSEYIYDPDMAEHLEDDALRSAIHLTPTDQERATTVVGDKEGVGAQGDSLEAMTTEGELNQGLYTQDEDGEQVPLLMNHNYMMVVNEANQVELYNSSDGTVVAGIVDDEGQLYTTQEVAVEQLIKKEGELQQNPVQNGDVQPVSDEAIEQVVVKQAE